MATQPPVEMPTPGDDTVTPPHMPHEIQSPSPDIDVPAPMPGGDPGTDPDYAQASPMGFAVGDQGASSVGHREPGDTDDIGSTDSMTASHGGMAGTSR